MGHDQNIHTSPSTPSIKVGKTVTDMMIILAAVTTIMKRNDADTRHLLIPVPLRHLGIRLDVGDVSLAASNDLFPTTG